VQALGSSGETEVEPTSGGGTSLLINNERQGL